MLKLPRNALLALLLLALVATWMLSGLFTDTPEETTSQETLSQTAVKVRVQQTQPESFTETLTLVGRSAPLTQATLAAQTSGDITTLMADRGDTVTTGTTLLKIDLATRNQDLSAAKAALEAAKVQAKTAKELFEEGFASEARLATERADLQATKQRVAQIEQDIAYTTVRAPINGIIEERLVDVGDFVAIGTPLFRVVNRETFLITGFAAQRDQNRITLGQTATARLANGQEISGQIRFIATQADAQTKTYRVDVEIDGSQYQIPTGMTADIHIPIAQIQATKIAHAHLVIDAEGDVGVMLAQEENDQTQAHFQPVDILQDDPDGVWVNNIPTGALLITRGQASVADGTVLSIQIQEG